MIVILLHIAGGILLVFALLFTTDAVHDSTVKQNVTVFDRKVARRYGYIALLFYACYELCVFLLWLADPGTDVINYTYGAVIVFLVGLGIGMTPSKQRHPSH